MPASLQFVHLGIQSYKFVCYNIMAHYLHCRSQECKVKKSEKYEILY